ncbi:ABC transporter ATP-binding protein [Microbacterium wangruii]|uniref:ABC transporter ATP-binding protein n=1 Tax=Microbacterium wangruii TaxID=3049073 RepID=UPI003364C191
MTASLPLPHDPAPDDVPAQNNVERSGGRPAAKPRKPRPRGSAASRKPAAAAVAPLVPAPPPLPPRPPLPPIPAAEAARAAVPATLPPRPAESAAAVAARIAEHRAAVSSVVAPAPAVEPEPIVEPAPIVEPEPEPEPIVEPEPTAEPEPGAAPEADDGAPLDDPEDTSVAGADAVESVMASLEGDVRADADDAVPALRLRGVTKMFGGVAVVDGIDLTVPAGAFYGLVGPNGAGKTTTLSMIAGLLRPDRGSVKVNGIDAAADPVAAKRLLGVLPDRLRTFDRLTGRQLLHYYGLLRGLPGPVADSRAADLARAFDLTDALSRPVSDYSGGMTKKIMLAGAMIHSPRVLVLDEPFEAVDPVSSAVILDILGAYVAHGGTVILSSHGMELVERVCTRVAVIVAGQVLAEGTVDEVRGELTLEQRFVELAGGLSDVEGLEWLHTFSD